jgi:hypothetical protein
MPRRVWRAEGNFVEFGFHLCMALEAALRLPDLEQGPSQPSHLCGQWRMLLLFFFFFLGGGFQDRVSLCSPGCPGTHFVDQAGLELRNPPTSASRVLRLKACATTPSLRMLLKMYDKSKYEMNRSNYFPYIPFLLILFLAK